MASRILSPYGRMRGDESAGNPIYTRQPPASPVHLTDSVLLTPGGSGSASVAALKNPMGQDMELLEIKFEIVGLNRGGASSCIGASVWCSISMGDIKLTNGAIPVWNFGRCENLESETDIDTPFGTTYQIFSWRLPRPLFIPAGAVVIPTFTHTGYVTDTLSVRVGYSARTVFKKPKKVYVPWVAKYASKAFNPLSAAGIDTSSELDLVNSNPEVVYLQRFVGRTQVLQPGGGRSEDFPQHFGSQYLVMRMADSYGRPVVRNYTPFRAVFSAVTRSWEMDNGASIDPGAFYIVSLRKDATSFDVGNTEANALGQAFVSMVGWREVDAL